MNSKYPQIFYNNKQLIKGQAVELEGGVLNSMTPFKEVNSTKQLGKCDNSTENSPKVVQSGN